MAAIFEILLDVVVATVGRSYGFNRGHGPLQRAVEEK